MYRDFRVCAVAIILVGACNGLLMSLVMGLSVAASVLIASGVVLLHGIILYVCRNHSIAGMGVRDWLSHRRIGRTESRPGTVVDHKSPSLNSTNS